MAQKKAKSNGKSEPSPSIWKTLFGQLPGAAFGVLVVICSALFTDFWKFRQDNEAAIHKQWDAVIDARLEFEAQLTSIDSFVNGKVEDIAAKQYSIKAQAFILALEDATRSLPEVGDEKERYVDTIVAMRKFFEIETAPKRGSDEWMIYYGNFRKSYDEYLTLRNAYFAALQQEMGDYKRYLTTL